MTTELPESGRFFFIRRPVPVPGDLRIAWRLSLLLLMLVTARGCKASLAKLHVLNDAIRAPAARERLSSILIEGNNKFNWSIRVEPALGRAIDFLIGEGLAEWTRSGGIHLTLSGEEAANSLLADDNALVEEKIFLNKVRHAVTEKFISALLDVKKAS